jgi:hypothetical protein
VVPGEEVHIAELADQVIDELVAENQNQDDMIQDQGSGVLQADSGSSAPLLQAGTGADKIVEIEPWQSVPNQSQVAATLSAASISPTGIQLESSRDIDQKVAIYNFLVVGLRQMINNQLLVGTPRFVGSIDILSSLIQIDLAALGISSLKSQDCHQHD